MRSICTLSLLAACLLASPAFAADAQSAPAKAPAAQSAPPAAASSPAMVAGAATFEATVVSVNLETHLVVLRSKEGETLELAAGADARNLNQLKPGDIVTAKYAEAIAMELKKVKGEAHTTVDTMVGRTPKGKKPGGLFERQVSFIADVSAVDTAAKKVSLKGAGGHVVAITVNDPAKLASVKVGDQVEGVFAQSLEISIKEKASKSEAAKPKK